ncbi:transcriptional regulator, AsnC family [Candidatus Caldarchaeum subterraneum]|uniref:Transcriptional regulator, AsnC family n=1 Tax=Caldiarchaeum subterraneum TaxID=311458 RepID=E6N978_CALS0|nr:transcriptional regulator, AsnC family [Candidatus Caldarchaeum subterraneum]BAJ51478.1 transcriptional regulator, AsnC family [Candidatus Caldarchaeum subterraneum]
MVDELDLKILNILFEDGRASFADIGRKLGVSENTVRFRFQKLVKTGVIRKVTVLVDHVKLGLKNSAALMLKIDPTKINRVLDELKQLREIANIYQLSGDFDAIAVAYGRDLDHIREIVEQIKKIPGIISVNTLVTLRVVKTDTRYGLV